MTEKERIDKLFGEFSRCWRLMWLAFGKTEPKGIHKGDVWEQCQYIPFECWSYILTNVRDMDTPPRNWAKKFKALHFQWKQTQCGSALDAEPKNRTVASGDRIGQKLSSLRERFPAMNIMERLNLSVDEFRDENQRPRRV